MQKVTEKGPITIDDLIILGRSVPVEIKNGRRPICIGGYSPTVGARVDYFYFTVSLFF